MKIVGWEWVLVTDDGQPVKSFGIRGVIFYAKVDVVIWTCVHFHENVGDAVRCSDSALRG